jgi:putative membrane protein
MRFFMGIWMLKVRSLKNVLNKTQTYLTYHTLAESTPYGGEGMMRNIYFFILITHILLAIAIVPLVLITFVRSIAEKFDKHKKIARITLPIWLYVTITGVVVYLMISPYY